MCLPISDYIYEHDFYIFCVPLKSCSFQTRLVSKCAIVLFETQFLHISPYYLLDSFLTNYEQIQPCLSLYFQYECHNLSKLLPLSSSPTQIYIVPSTYSNFFGKFIHTNFEETKIINLRFLRLRLQYSFTFIFGFDLIPIFRFDICHFVIYYILYGIVLDVVPLQYINIVRKNWDNNIHHRSVSINHIYLRIII